MKSKRLKCWCGKTYNANDKKRFKLHQERHTKKKKS